MVDIMDMEDIIFEIILTSGLNANDMAPLIAKEVKDFVEAQQTIKCANCKGKAFKNMKEPWQVQ